MPNPSKMDESLSQQLLENISDAFFAVDQAWQFTYLNSQAIKLIDRFFENLLGKNIWKVFPEALGSIFEHEFRRAISEQVTVSFEAFYPPHDTWYAVRAYPIASGLAVYFQDVTEQKIEDSDRKRTEENLRRSEERYRALFDAIDEGFCVIEMVFDANNTPVDYRFLELNSAFEKHTGLEQAVGKTARQLIPNLEEYWFKTYGNVALTGESARFEHGSDSMNRWFDVFAFSLGDRKVGLRFKDISDRKRTENDLLQKNAILQVINQSSPTPIFVKNRQGQIIYANPATLEVLGKSEAEVIGFRDCDLYAADAARVMANDQRVMESGKTEVVEESPDGVRTFLGTKAPYCNEEGEVIGLIGIANDISARVQMEREKEQVLQREQAAREAAEKANRIKDEFLAVLSHELRSPLNPILGWSKLLQSGRLSATQTADALKIIERNANLQAKLIDDLLDVSRILRGKLPLNIAPVTLPIMIRAALETVRLAAAAKHITIQTIFDANVQQVSGDAGRLQQVIWNLLSNAVKFTPEGGRVEVRLTQIDNQAQIQVSDTGKGINPDFLPYVFDRFRQEDGATTRQFGGLGLGLAIVRQLVELHGGTISVDSAGENQGAIFTVQFPCIAESKPVVDIESNTCDVVQPSTIPLAGLKVLVVDDDKDSRDFITFVLQDEGAKVQSVSSAIAALEVLAQSSMDLLISDIGMPEMDGYMLIEQVRTRLPLEQRQIPAIALTAYAGELNERQVLEAGFHKHLSKPIDPTELLMTLADLLDQSESALKT